MSKKNQSLLNKQTKTLSKNKQKRIAAALAVVGATSIIALGGQTSVQAASTDTVAATASTDTAATTASTDISTAALSTAEIQTGLDTNVKDNVTVSADIVEAALGTGPFTAGVNSVIPFEAFGGDGMLTRLLLGASDGAPWSDNGTANNAAILPIEGLTNDTYFYEVDLNGAAAGKTGEALVQALRQAGASSYTATVKVYAAGADGKANTATVVATKTVNVNVEASAVQQQVTSNVLDTVNVPKEYVYSATGTGPFTAGVNSTIPFEAFGGDGMLTRLLLSSSANAPWSNNGVDKNAGLSPVIGNEVSADKYYYEVDLDGAAAGLTGQALVDALKANGDSYTATVKVYNENTAGNAADTSKVVATKTVKVNLVSSELQNAVDTNIKDSISVPTSYVNNATATGPFTAGVNSIIPFEDFGGDGMLTRLLLAASDGAKWSDNGVDKKPAILPVENLASGKYFYEVDLDGAASGLTGGDLITALKNNPGSYTATVKVYAAGTDGKADTNNVVAETTSTVNIQSEKQTLYRAYNPNTGEHLYTLNRAEFNNLVSLGWNDEGTAWNAATSGTPVYRLYNPNSGEHLYTIDTAEYASLGALGWKQEGVAFYSDTNKGVAVYRLYNANEKAFNHHYTTSTTERDFLASLGWKNENVAFYGVK